MLFACTPVTSVALTRLRKARPIQRETVAMHENCRGHDDRHFRWQCPMNSRPAPQYFARKAGLPDCVPADKLKDMPILIRVKSCDQQRASMTR